MFPSHNVQTPRLVAWLSTIDVCDSQRCCSLPSRPLSRIRTFAHGETMQCRARFSSRTVPNAIDHRERFSGSARTRVFACSAIRFDVRALLAVFTPCSNVKVIDYEAPEVVVLGKDSSVKHDPTQKVVVYGSTGEQDSSYDLLWTQVTSRPNPSFGVSRSAAGRRPPGMSVSCMTVDFQTPSLEGRQNCNDVGSSSL